MIARTHGDQAGSFKRAKQAAEVSRVECETSPEGSDVAPSLADLPQDPRLSERSPAVEVAVVQGADPLRHGPVEPPHLPNHRIVHLPDFSQEVHAGRVAAHCRRTTR